MRIHGHHGPNPHDPAIEWCSGCGQVRDLEGDDMCGECAESFEEAIMAGVEWDRRFEADEAAL